MFKAILMTWVAASAIMVGAAHAQPQGKSAGGGSQPQPAPTHGCGRCAT